MTSAVTWLASLNKSEAIGLVGSVGTVLGVVIAWLAFRRNSRRTADDGFVPDAYVPILRRRRGRKRLFELLPFRWYLTAGEDSGSVVVEDPTLADRFVQARKTIR